MGSDEHPPWWYLESSVCCLFVPLWSSVPSIVLPFLEYHVVEVVWCVAFSDWLLSLNNIYIYCFSVPFCAMGAHFSFVLNIFQFWMLHTLFLHSPTESILVASESWQLWIKLLSAFVCKCWGEHKLSVPLSKHQGAQLWDYMVRAYLVL